MMRKRPNIIITGTPGVGKTVHCERLAESTGLVHLSINKVAKERGCHDGYDEELKSWIIEEEKLLDSIQDEAKEGGRIIDWHGCDLFPESWIDLVIVLRTNPTLLYDRLTERKYTAKKVDENMDSEIMQVLLEEARESYDSQIIIELQSDGPEDVDNNIDRIQTWISMWCNDHA